MSPPPRLRLHFLSTITAALVASGITLISSYFPQATDSAVASTQSGYHTAAKEAILVDAKTGLVLYEKGADRRIDPASMAKLMTLAIVFQQLKSGKLTLDQQFKVSEHAWRTGGAPSGTAAMFAPIHSMISVDQLIQGITVQSGNDACLVLAEGIAGSEAGFVKMMNEEAKAMGLTGSHFANSTGLSAPGETMTVRDLATLARYLMDNYPEYYHYFGEQSFTFTKFTFRNRNSLIFQDIGVDGLKTGSSKSTGYGLVASAVKGKRRLIAVESGLKTARARDDTMRKLLDWGFTSFKKYRLFNADEKVSRALVWGGTKHYVSLVGKGNIDVLLPISDDPQVTASISYKGPVKAPIKKGQQVGELWVKSTTLNAQNRIPLYAGEDIGQSNFAMRGLDSLFVMAFGWILYMNHGLPT